MKEAESLRIIINQDPFEQFKDDSYIQRAKEMFTNSSTMHFEIFHCAMYLRWKDWADKNLN